MTYYPNWVYYQAERFGIEPEDIYGPPIESDSDAVKEDVLQPDGLLSGAREGRPMLGGVAYARITHLLRGPPTLGIRERFHQVPLQSVVQGMKARILR